MAKERTKKDVTESKPVAQHSYCVKGQAKMTKKHQCVISHVIDKDSHTFTSLVEELAMPSPINEAPAGPLDYKPLPSRDTVYRIVEELRAVMFPGYFGFSDLNPKSVKYHIGAIIDRIQYPLQEQIRRGLCFACTEASCTCTPDDKKALSITRDFLHQLPKIQRQLANDVQAAFDGDPAALVKDEIIFCYPALTAITNYRLAHNLHLLGVPLIPRIITEHAHSLTGIDIHPGAEIGECFFIDHGTGVVIGETCVIGNNVRLYQGVTLGAKSFKSDEQGHLAKGYPRHPIVEDDVVIYANATILGRITIGRGSSIGGNVWLTESVPPESRITQALEQTDKNV